MMEHKLPESLLIALWEEFGNVPIDDLDETTEEGFLGWPIITDRFEIWHWFDDQFEDGLAAHLYTKES